MVIAYVMTCEWFPPITLEVLIQPFILSVSHWFDFFFFFPCQLEAGTLFTRVSTGESWLQLVVVPNGPVHTLPQVQFSYQNISPLSSGFLANHCNHLYHHLHCPMYPTLVFYNTLIPQSSLQFKSRREKMRRKGGGLINYNKISHGKEG